MNATDGNATTSTTTTSTPTGTVTTTLNLSGTTQSTTTTTTTTTTTNTIVTTNDGATSGELEKIQLSDWMVPEVTEDFLTPVDTVFVWLRYIHFALAPIVIFIIHKDLRKKAKDLLCCWRPNSVQNSSPRPISAYLREKRKIMNEQKKKFKNVTNYR